MATLNVTLENGFFSTSNGIYVTEFTPTHVVGNGWDCTVRMDGSILCEAVRTYADGVHSMRYEITKNGFAKLTLKVRNEPVRTIRKGFVLPRGAKLADGTIGLSGGCVDDRYAFFRDAAFNKFLAKFGLTAVRHEDPNQSFVVRKARYGGGECNSDLITDGAKEEVSFDSGRTDEWRAHNPGTCSYEWETTYRVTGASWLIHEVSKHEGDCHRYARVLYTQEKDLDRLKESLMGNPDVALFVKKEQQAKSLKALDGKAVRSADELQEVVEKINGICPGIKAVQTAEFFQGSIEVHGPMPRSLYEMEIFVVNTIDHEDGTYTERKTLVARGHRG